jgi:hypothetical protein
MENLEIFARLKSPIVKLLLMEGLGDLAVAQLGSQSQPTNQPTPSPIVPSV